MKKKTIFTVAAAMLLLSGCAEKKGDSAGYQVYYTNEDGDTLLSAGYQIMGDDTLACIQEMWKKMQDTMQGNGQSSLVPEKLEIQELDLTGGQLIIETEVDAAAQKFDEIIKEKRAGLGIDSGINKGGDAIC